MKKKIIVILICSAMTLSLAACGSSDTSEKEEDKESEADVQSETEEEQETEIKDEKEEDKEAQQDIETESQAEDQTVDTSELAPVVVCFAELAESVGEMTYDEALEYMRDSGLTYDAVEPSADDMGTITTQDDENGCHLYIFVYPDDNDVNIVSTVSYGNDHFSGSADDNMHMDKVSYKTYNIYDEEKSTEVGSLQDVIDYINNEIPALIEEDNARPEGEPIDVTMDATEETTSNGTYFTIETNLPDGMSLMLTLTGSNNFRAQDKATVKNGKAVSSAFSNKGSALKGDYELEVTSGLATTQDDDVQSIIGIDGENLTGEYVETDDSGKSMVTATFNFTF